MTGLPSDWKPPVQALLEREWQRHPRRDQLVALLRERDEDGFCKWEQALEPDEDDPTWTALWLRPADPRDERPGIRVLRYPNVWLNREYARARAIVDEHHLD